MEATRLRLFRGGEGETSGNSPVPSQVIRLGDLFPLLARSAEGDATWLRGLEAAELRVSRDLLEVAKAFSRCRPPETRRPG